MKYEGVSDELLERIARDVRAWDKSRTPEVKSADSLSAIKQTLADIYDYDQNKQRDRERSALAQELLAVATVLQLPEEVQAKLAGGPAWLLLKDYGFEIPTVEGS